MTNLGISERSTNRVLAELSIEPASGESTSSARTVWNRIDWFVVAALVIVGWLLFGWRVERRGIWSAHEGRAAQDAQSILDDGDWLIPTLFIDAPDYQKPPLYYWCVATIAKFRGQPVDAFAIRLPAVLAALGCLVCVYRIAGRLWDRSTAILAVALLASTTRFAWLARVGRIDMPLTLCCSVALIQYWKLISEPGKVGKRSKILFYAAIAIGCLFKGPVAAVLVFLPIFAHSWMIRPRSQANGATDWLRWLNRRLGLVVGLFAVVSVCMPWYAYAIWKTRGSFFWEFFVYHNLERALGSSEGLKSGPIWFYVPRLLVDTFPWSLLFPAFGIALWQKRGRIRQQLESWPPELLFLLCWCGTQFAFLSMVSFKRADYLLPLYPGLALLLTCWLHERAERFERRHAIKPARNPKRRARWIVATAAALVLLTAPLWIWGSIEFLKKGLVQSLLKVDAVSENFNGTDRFMLDHIERLMRDNGPLLAIGGMVVLGCIWLFHTGWHDRRNRRIVAGLSLPWAVAFLFQIHLFLPAIDPLREMSRFGSLIRFIATPQQPIHYFEKFDADLVFHAGRPARMVFDSDDLAELAQTAEPSFVVIKAKDLAMFRSDPRLSAWREIADNCQTAFGEHRDPRILLTNRPQAIAERVRQSATL